MSDELDSTLARGGEEAQGATPDAGADAGITTAEPEAEVAGEAAGEEEPQASTAALPEPIPAPRPAAPSPSVDAPRLRDVGSALGAWVRGRAQVAGTFLGTHRLCALTLALAGMALILAAVLWGADAARTPSDEQILADARDRLAAPAHTVSPYEDDRPLVFQTAEVVRKQASGTRHDACAVSVMATFGNGAIESRAEAELTYVRAGDGWTCTAATEGKASHRALAGVSDERTLAQADALLRAADTDPDAESLAALYRDARFAVTDEAFDAEAQTATLRLHGTSLGTFVSYECDLTAHFRFASASGCWELAQVEASDDARELSLAPLVGTWQGTFAHQESTLGKCLAARDAGLTVVVEQAALTDDGDARIKGTVSGIAHLHGDHDQDADATEGDLALEAVPFAGTLSTGERDLDVISLLAGNNPKADAAGIVFDCATQDLAAGRVTLTLTFGEATDPEAASATLTSTHSYQDFFLLVVPYQRDVRFVDHFTLEKVG